MTQWPEDRELSRLYRELPEAVPSANLKERVLAVAMEHAAAMRKTQMAKTEPSATHHPSFWARVLGGGWMPVGLAASIVLSVVAVLLIRSAPESQPVIVAQQDISATTPEPAETSDRLPPRMRIAEVEPARRDSGSTTRNEDVEIHEPVLRPEQDEDVTAQASGGLPGGAGEEVAKGYASSGARPPEAWLDEIRTLQKQGKLISAKEKMRAFRRKYPDYSLPEDLAQIAH